MKDLMGNFASKTLGASGAGIGAFMAGLVPADVTWPVVALFAVGIVAFGAERVAKIIKGVPTDEK